MTLPASAGSRVLRRHLASHVVPGEGVLLFGEHGSAVLPGAASEFALRAVTTGLAAVAPDAAAAATALPDWESAGLLTEAVVTEDGRSAGYWDCAAVSATAAEAGTRRPVAVRTVGAVPRPAVHAVLAAAGLHLVPEQDATAAAALVLVLTDDYLRPELDDWAAELRAAGRPWILAKPVGVRLTIGPVFDADGPCYRCLADRLRANRPVEAFLCRRSNQDERLDLARWPRPPVVDTAASRMLGLGLVATAAVNWLGGGASTSASSLTIFDALAWTSTSHRVTRRPQCACCGDAELVGRRMAAPVRPGRRPASDHRDGGERAVPPEEMLARVDHLIDPVIGVVTELREVVTGLPFIDLWSSGPIRAIPARSLDALRAGPLVRSFGKGTTRAQARASAVGEALERASAVFQGDEPRIRSSQRALGDAAVPPNEVLLFSAQQLARRSDQPEGPHRREVAAPLDPGVEVDWTPLWSLTEKRRRYLPSAQLFFGHPQAGAPCWADSNGNAAGSSVEDALLQGCYELVERDAVGIWWYNRLRRPAVDLDLLSDPWLGRVRDAHRELGRELWALDLRTDLEIPVVAALSRRVDRSTQDVVFGFGAHRDDRIALRRAVSELHQMLPAVAHAGGDASGDATATDEQRSWWRTATVHHQPYLLPDPLALPVAFSGCASDPISAGADLHQHWEWLQARLERSGLEVLAIDMTRPDIGLPVVKVVVPGLRHFWARFAPGRLYDVPVRTGDLNRPATESELNPISLFV